MKYKLPNYRYMKKMFKQKFGNRSVSNVYFVLISKNHKAKQKYTPIMLIPKNTEKKEIENKLKNKLVLSQNKESLLFRKCYITNKITGLLYSDT